MALSLSLTRRRRTAVVRPVVVTEEVVVTPAPEPEPVIAPVVTNRFAGLEAALTTGQARLNLMRTLRGY